MLTFRGGGSRGGFTLIEMIVALVVLAIVVLGSALTSGRLARTAAEAEVQAMAVQVAESRLSEIRMDTRYTQLDSLYEGTESDLPGLPGFSRETSITHVQESIPGGGVRDFRRVLVKVVGAVLGSPITREIVVAAP
jgi:prepilin-type N-terminal cleavage/methylation domain-containing protein